jgi:hypothetical protein
MTPMSTRQRAVLDLPSPLTLFVNIIGISCDRYSIKSVSCALMKEKVNGINAASTVLFFDKYGVAVQQSTIEVPDGWTPRLLLGVLLLEWSSASKIISIFQAKGKLDDIPQIRRAYFSSTTTQLNKTTIRLPSYSFIIGGF